MGGRRAWTAALLAVSTAVAVPALGGEADVVAVEVRAGDGAGVYDFAVTVAHADEGWEHYADWWAVVDGQGAVLATRVLAHPHVDEQPFTRGLSDVAVPDGVRTVVVRARDSVHGYGGAEMTVTLPQR